MAKRTPFVGGNWKMNTNRASAIALAEQVAASCGELPKDACEVAIFPPFPYLDVVSQRLAAADSSILLGAQDVWHEPDGAFTGEVSAAMLADLGARYVLAGHSERRHVIGEDDQLINRKVRAAIGHRPSAPADGPTDGRHPTADGSLNVVLCVGETLEQRQAGRTEDVVLGQVRAGLEGVAAEDLPRIVIAYEPVWAIGTGRTASPEDAQAVHAAIRKALNSGYHGTLADSLRIVYGGSVKSSNAEALFTQPDIDGGLIGGASLDAAEFEAIVRAAVKKEHVTG